MIGDDLDPTSLISIKYAILHITYPLNVYHAYATPRILTCQGVPYLHNHYLLLALHDLVHDPMYPIPFALDDLTILDHARRPLDAYPVSLRALLYQVFFDEVPPSLSLPRLHVR